jgi:hypothetical protein
MTVSNGQGEIAQVFTVGSRLNNENVIDKERLFQARMRMSPDDHVESVDMGGQGRILVYSLMGQCDEEISFRTKLTDPFLNRLSG